MNVTIFGAGNMGKALGTRFAAGGHSITFVSRNPENAEKAVSIVRVAAKGGAMVDSATQDNVKLGDVVVQAVWYGTNIELVKQLGARLTGKVVVDIANPVNSTYNGLITAPDSSSAEDVAKVSTAGVNVVKAFNTTFSSTLLSGKVAGQTLDVFIAGDDPDAKTIVGQLIKDGGMRPVNTGSLSSARLIEGMALLHILVQGSLGTNWDSSVKILS